MIDWRSRLRQRQLPLSPVEWACIERHASTPVDPNNVSEADQKLLEAVDSIHQTFDDVKRYALSARVIRGAEATRLISTVFEQAVRIEWNQVPSDTTVFCCVSQATSNLLQASVYDANDRCINKWFVHVRYMRLVEAWIVIAQHKKYVTESRRTNQLPSLYNALQEMIAIIYYSNFL